MSSITNDPSPAGGPAGWTQWMDVKCPLDTQVSRPLLPHTSASEKEDQKRPRLRPEPLKIIEKNKRVTKLSPSLCGGHKNRFRVSLLEYLFFHVYFSLLFMASGDIYR